MPHLIACGLDYKSQPVAVRERLTIPPSCLHQALKHLQSLPAINESAIIATCNRFEVYAVTTGREEGTSQVKSFFQAVQAVSDHHDLAPSMVKTDEQAVAHLCRVASGLESMVVGEGQILAQVKDAYQAALDADCAGPVLRRLFDLALHCGKRVRTETKISSGAVSTGAAAIEIARQNFGGLKSRTLLLVGAGRAAQMCAKQLLSSRDCPSIQVVNRSGEGLLGMQELNVEGRLSLCHSYEERHELSAGADVVIVTTAAPEFVLTRAELEKQATVPGVVIDLSVPRNVDPAIGGFSETKLYTVDDLAQVVESNLAERAALCAGAHKIIAEILDRRWTPYVVRRFAAPGRS